MLSSAPVQRFKNLSDPCTCNTAVSFMVQCRHKIKLKNKFDIDDFDIGHHYRSKCSTIKLDNTSILDNGDVDFGYTLPPTIIRKLDTQDEFPRKKISYTDSLLGLSDHSVDSDKETVHYHDSSSAWLLR
jgi:hypothetical protein